MDDDNYDYGGDLGRDYNRPDEGAIIVPTFACALVILLIIAAFVVTAVVVIHG